MHWACIEDVMGMHEMHSGWNVDATINKGCRELQHCGCKRDAERMQLCTLRGCKGMQVAYREDRPTTNLPKDAGDAKWMHQACRHFHTGCKACIVDSVELHSFLSTLLYHAMYLLVGGYVTGCWLAQDRLLHALDARRMHCCILNIKYTCNLLGLYVTAVQIWAMNPGTLFQIEQLSSNISSQTQAAI